ncbi:MAG TPA: sugar phosphate isomerase/epimerase family protein [Spirochaetia bacterium]|nr:sugar phosphate isomerase/epimerase family protein [Spirochaetia bacterium]
MKLAFSSLGCPEYTFEQMIAAAEQFGFQGVSIRTAEGTTDLLGLPDFSARLPESRARLRDTGVELLCVSTGVRFASELRQEREDQLDEARRYIDLALELSAPFVRIFGGPVEPTPDYERTMNYVVEGFRSATDYAGPLGVEVLVETHDTFAKGSSTRDILNRVGREAVGVIWDILHSLRNGESFRDTVAELGTDVRNVHLKDSSDFDSRHFDVTLCGEGRVPIRDALMLLDASGYSGYYEFEWEKAWNPGIPPASVAFPHFVRYITDLRRSLDARDPYASHPGK